MPLSEKTLSETTSISADKPFTRLSNTNPDVVIRTERSIGIDATEESIREMITDQKRVFADVRRHGIMVPRFYSLPHPPSHEGEEWDMDTVMQKVDGVNLNQIQGTSPNEADQAGNAMEETYIRLLTYYREKLDTRQPALEDIFDTEQWMYGHVPNSSTNHIYLVDTDAFVHRFTEEGIARELLKFLATLEGTFQKQFEEAREKYQEVFPL